MNMRASQFRCYARGNCKFERVAEARRSLAAPSSAGARSRTHRNNQLKCSLCFLSQSLRRASLAPDARGCSSCRGASIIKYATMYAARWVRIYAFIPTALPLPHPSATPPPAAERKLVGRDPSSPGRGISSEGSSIARRFIPPKLK